MVVETLRAIKYLKIKGYTFSPILITTKPGERLKKSLKFNLVESAANQTLCLRKTNLNISIKLTAKSSLTNVLDSLKGIGRRLLNKCGLHPCPKTYALFHVLKNRKILPTVNLLLDKYWYPTWKIKELKEEEIIIEFSIPPLSPNKQE